MASFYRIGVENILVAHDELDLLPGDVRLKRSGGHGGHNGLRDIIKHLGRDFIRVRLGIGHPGNAKQVSSFVLKRASAAEQKLLEQCIDDVIRELPSIVSGDLEAAMRVLHTKPKPDQTAAAEKPAKANREN